MFNVETDSGIASARINGQYIDAGRSGDMAGIEFSVDRMRMADGPRNQRHADAIVTLDCTPATLLQVATVILDKLDLPAFNDRQWRLIEGACNLAVANSLDDPALVAELREIASKIFTSAAKIAAL